MMDYEQFLMFPSLQVVLDINGASRTLNKLGGYKTELLC